MNQQCAVFGCDNETEHRSNTCWMHADVKVKDIIRTVKPIKH